MAILSLATPRSLGCPACRDPRGTPHKGSAARSRLCASATRGRAGTPPPPPATGAPVRRQAAAERPPLPQLGQRLHAAILPQGGNRAVRSCCVAHQPEVCQLNYREETQNSPIWAAVVMNPPDVIAAPNGGYLRAHAKTQVALRDGLPRQPASSAGGVHVSRLTAWCGRGPCRPAVLNSVGGRCGRPPSGWRRINMQGCSVISVCGFSLRVRVPRLSRRAPRAVVLVRRRLLPPGGKR